MDPIIDIRGLTKRFKGKPAPPKLVSPVDRLFRTMIRQGASKGPNFAGHYTIAEWGCGSSCVSIALMDAKDDTIFNISMSGKNRNSSSFAKSSLFPLDDDRYIT